jgi:hypothetical protein
VLNVLVVQLRYCAASREVNGLPFAGEKSGGSGRGLRTSVRCDLLGGISPAPPPGAGPLFFLVLPIAPAGHFDFQENKFRCQVFSAHFVTLSRRIVPEKMDDAG